MIMGDVAMLGRMATLKGTETLGDAVMLRHMATLKGTETLGDVAMLGRMATLGDMVAWGHDDTGGHGDYKDIMKVEDTVTLEGR